MKAPRPRRKRIRVMLAMDWLDYELNLGIAQFGREVGWIVDDLIVHTGQPPTKWTGDGAIAMLNHPTGKLVPFVRSLTCPVVDLANEVQDLDVPRVLADDYGIGATGAEHLLSCGVMHFAFFNHWDTRTELERMRGFRETVERAGRTFYVIRGAEMNVATVDSDELSLWIAARLLELPRPLGVMAQHDRESMMIINGCEAAGLAVPEDIAVVGSNNDLLLCELGPVHLSSVDTRRRDQGYRAAQMLNSLIKGVRPAAATVRVPSGPVTVRQSSEVLAVSDPDLSRALQYIADHYREPLRVSDIVDHADTSRRKLYQLFERHLGRPIHSEILRRRLDHARRLLVTTSDKLYSIARACGFLDDQQLNRAFTREIGMSPSRYRQQQAPQYGATKTDPGAKSTSTEKYTG